MDKNIISKIGTALYHISSYSSHQTHKKSLTLHKSQDSSVHVILDDPLSSHGI